MKIKTLITFYLNGEFVKPGSVIELDDAEAKVHIGRKFAKEVDFEEAEIIQPSDTASPEDLVGSTVQIPGVAGDFTLDQVLGDGTLVASPADASAETETDAGDMEDLFGDEDTADAPAEAPVTAPVKPKGKGK